MGLDHPTNRLTRLWQLPAFVLALVLFAYAAWLFIDPQPSASAAQKLHHALELLKQERAEAALESINELLANERLQPLEEGAARVMLAEAIDLAQRQRKLNLPENHRKIIEQTRRGIALGIEPDARIRQRIAESQEATGRLGDAQEQYKHLMHLDPGLSLKWQRKVIELSLRRDLGNEAEQELGSYLSRKELARSERAWALGEIARLLVDKGQLEQARVRLDEALKLEAGEAADQGQFNYWMGYCAWKLKDLANAEKHLRVARDQLKVQHPLDAEAAYALGRICQEKGEFAAAQSFYSAVLSEHLDSRVAELARLGRGICRVALGNEQGGLGDLSELMRRLRGRDLADGAMKSEMLLGLKAVSTRLASAGNMPGALEAMAYEQELGVKPAAEFYGRLGRLYEQYAGQLEAEVPPGGDAKAAADAKLREVRVKAGDAYAAYAMALTLSDDKASGQAMWKGVEWYDKAGELPRMIQALETFIAERPDDSLAPDATLRLGQAYHASGQFDQAIRTYRHNQIRYPKSLAASKSGVPLARAYIAKGPTQYGKAEEVLRAVIEDNPQITPDAAEFRESLFELAQLFYRTGRYEQSVAKLDEMHQRYAQDERMGQVLFLMADSYRKSATLLEEQLAKAAAAGPATKPAFDIAEATQQRKSRLAQARDGYTRVIDVLRPREASTELDRLYLKLSHFYRADCVFELGDYPEAVKLYGEAAFRYQDDPAALAAYVQMVNANVAMGKLDEAKAANERAKWMLRRMPQGSFEGGSGSLALSQRHWEQWLKWAGESGIWK